MKICAKTPYGDFVYIVGFVYDTAVVAITVNTRGSLYRYRISELRVVDERYIP